MLARLFIARADGGMFPKTLFQLQNALVSAAAEAEVHIFFREDKLAVHKDIRELQNALGRLGVTARIFAVRQLLKGVA